MLSAFATMDGSEPSLSDMILSRRRVSLVMYMNEWKATNDYMRTGALRLATMKIKQRHRSEIELNVHFQSVSSNVVQPF